MVQISISTIIWAVLACVGPTLAAPITRDFNGLEIRQLSYDPCRQLPGHLLKRTIAGTEPADPPKGDIPDYYGIDDCSNMVFEREITDQEDNGGPSRDFKGEAQDTKSKAHEQQQPPGGAPLNDAKGSGRKREKASNRRRDLEDEILQMFARDFDKDRYWS
jgi:hypothetical protein